MRTLWDRTETQAGSTATCSSRTSQADDPMLARSGRTRTSAMVRTPCVERARRSIPAPRFSALCQSRLTTDTVAGEAGWPSRPVPANNARCNFSVRRASPQSHHEIAVVTAGRKCSSIRRKSK
jgi:hypothetical protein